MITSSCNLSATHHRQIVCLLLPAGTGLPDLHGAAPVNTIAFSYSGLVLFLGNASVTHTMIPTVTAIALNSLLPGPDRSSADNTVDKLRGSHNSCRSDRVRSSVFLIVNGRRSNDQMAIFRLSMSFIRAIAWIG